MKTFAEWILKTELRSGSEECEIAHRWLFMEITKRKAAGEPCDRKQHIWKLPIISPCHEELDFLLRGYQGYKKRYKEALAQLDNDTFQHEWDALTYKELIQNPYEEDHRS